MNKHKLSAQQKRAEERWMSKSKNSAQSVMSSSLWPHGMQHVKLPCPLPTLRVCSISCPSSSWCHPTNSSSVIPFSSYLQSFPASESFPVSQFFASGGQSIGVSASASVLPMNIQGWFPLNGLVGFPCCPRDSQEDMKPSEISQSQKDNYCMIPFVWDYLK